MGCTLPYKPEVQARGIRGPAPQATRIPLLALRAWMAVERAGCRCFSCIQSSRSSNRRLRESSRDSWGIAYRTPTLSVMETLPSGA